MKRLALVFLFLMAMGALFAQHPAYFQAQLPGNAMPNAADVTFEADRTEFPGVFLTQESGGCSITETPGNNAILITIQCSTFPTAQAWAPGQTVRVTLTHTPSGQTAYGELLTTSAGYDANMDMLVFAGGTTNYTVAGNITHDLDPVGPLAGVMVKAMDGEIEAATATTDASGNYTLTVAEGTYNLMAVKAGWTFNPNPMNNVVVDMNLTGKDFMAISPNPGTPTDPFPTGTNVAANPILSWTAPIDGASVTSYQLIYNINNGADQTVVVTDPNYQISGSFAGATVNARVKAYHNPEARSLNGKVSKTRGYSPELAWSFTMGTPGSAGGNDDAQGSGSQQGGEANIDLPPVDDDGTEGGNEYDTGVVIDPDPEGDTAPPTPVEVVVTTNYGNLGEVGGNGNGFVIGMVITASNDWFAGLITFDLGVDPVALFNLGSGGYIAYKAGSQWIELTEGVAPLNENEYRIIGTSIQFNPGSLGRGDLVFAGGTDNFTLPVTLSSFSATFSNENNGQVAINWVTASEISLLGYNVLKSTSDDVNLATPINPSIIQGEGGSSTSTEYSFVDTDIEPNARYNYWLQSLDLDGTVSYFGPSTVEINITGGGDVNHVTTALQAAYPNPFSSKVANNVKVRYAANEGETVTFKIFNVKGQLVETHTRQNHTTPFTWNPKNAASGVYFYQMETKNFKQTKKLLIVK